MPEDAKPSDDVKKDVKIGETAKKDGKKGGKFVQKYKWYILGAIVLLGVILVWFVNRKNGAAGGTSQDASSQAAVDPNTGYLNGSPADLAALGSSGISAGAPVQGDPGPAGPSGPTGPAGPVSLYAIAKRILEARGIHNPSRAQIMHVRATLEHVGLKPITHKPVQHKNPVGNAPKMHPGKKAA